MGTDIPHPSTEHTIFMDDRSILISPSMKRAVFMDEQAFLREPSTKMRVFVDRTKIFGRRGLTDWIKWVYLSVYERVLFGRMRGRRDCRDAKTLHIWRRTIVLWVFQRKREIAKERLKKMGHTGIFIQTERKCRIYSAARRNSGLECGHLPEQLTSKKMCGFLPSK